MSLVTETVTLQCEWYDPSCAFTYLSSQISYLLLNILDSFFSGVASVFELISLPSFVSDFSSYQLPSFFLYITDVFQIYEGLLIVMSAYSIRFLIRRIPFFG